jgi:hypothetical protein
LALVRRQASFWALEQERVLAGLAGTGLEPVVLKGGALRHTAFESPVERTMGDLDLLVSRDRVDEALAALGRLGYRSPYPDAASEGFRAHHYHERLAHANGFEVEVHWGLTRPDAPATLDDRAFLDRALPVTPETGPPLHVPSPEDNLLHAVSQSEIGSFRKLSRLVDIDRIVTSTPLDWDYIERAADEGGLAGHLALALRIANLLFGTPAPNRPLTGRPLGSLARRSLGALDPVRHLMEPPGRAAFPRNHLIRLWSRSDAARRWRALREVGAEEDPLDWVWEIHISMKEGVDPEDVARKPVRRGVLLAKLALLQGMLLPGIAVGGRGFWAR